MTTASVREINIDCLHSWLHDIAYPQVVSLTREFSLTHHHLMSSSDSEHNLIQSEEARISKENLDRLLSVVSIVELHLHSVD